MNSQIKIKQLADHTFDYEIFFKYPFNYRYSHSAGYFISHWGYSLKNSKIVFQL